jgi:hypothetical protein
MSLYWNGAEVNTLMYNGVETTGVYNGNIVWGNNTQQAKTLTLYHSEGGSLTADTLTGYPGDSVNLTTAYNTYWRFSGYDVTGDGTLNGNTYTFGTEDATICACYKVNAFTASGGWEQGSDVAAVGKRQNVTASVNKFAITSYHTSNVPTAWYSTSNRWKVTSTVSAYSINLKPIMKVRLQSERHGRGATASFSTNIGGSYTTTATYSENGTSKTTTATYSKNITTGTTGVNYSISACIIGKYDNGYAGTATYLANQTTGTWTATGYAP